MKLTSYGAAEDVTGSKHLVEVNGARMLLDCGMFQGRREEAAARNKTLPFDVASLSAVVLSHAHIDHCGTLPMLARRDFQGRIYSTPATRSLCAIMLADSARIQEKDARWLSKKRQTFVPPPYTEADARAIMKRFVSLPYELSFEPIPGVTATFQDAGHILGSAMVDIEIRENGHTKKLIYSGDIGRKHMPILNDPWEPADADIVIMESTYGNRDHDPIETLDGKLAEVIKRTHARGGKIIVPTFALERAQEFIYALKRLEMQNRIPEIPVYVDSPMAVSVTEVFREFRELFDDEALNILEQAGDPFQLRHIQYIRNLEDSMKLNQLREPAIILSASGMCEYGRILHHLRNNVEDDRNTILIIGFQAQYTLGRRIVERDPEIKIFGMKHRLNAEVKVLNSLSAHAGRSDLLEFGARFKGRAEHVLLVHGETEAQDALLAGLKEKGMDNVRIQKEAETEEF